jgi:hypothetical protein
MIEMKTVDVEDAVAWIREMAGPDTPVARRLRELAPESS